MTREEAMDFVIRAINRTWNEKTCKEILKALERQTGHWDFFCQHWRKCSECGNTHKFAEEWDYCPNCGAKMRKESE